MPKPSDNEKQKAAPRTLRPHSAVFADEPVAVVPPQGQKAKTNAGRWRLYSGAAVQTRVYGLNMVAGYYGMTPQPIRLIVDLATAQFEKPKVLALRDHSSWCMLGAWSGGEITEEGIFADLDLAQYDPQHPEEQDALAYAIEVGAWLRRDLPWQASIGSSPAAGLDGYELVPRGETVDVNGQTLSGDGDLPLYVARQSVVFESSVVLWGADDETGRIAAARDTTPPTTESPMTVNLKAALARHPNHKALVADLVADSKSDVEIDAAVNAKLHADKDAEIVALKQRAEGAEAKLAAAPKPAAAAAAPAVAAPAQAAAAPAQLAASGDGSGAGEEPKTISEGIKLLRADGSKLVGFALYEAARKRWPNAERR